MGLPPVPKIKEEMKQHTDNHEIRNLIFDFGKVLVDYDFEPPIQRFFKDADKARRFLEIVCDDGFIDRCDLEAMPFAEIIEDMKSKHPEFADAFDNFRDNYCDFVTGEVDGMHELLSRLKTMGYRLYGLTNWCSKVYDIIAQYEIFGLLDGYVVSSDVKQIKPDKAIYQTLCDKFNLNPEECVFADDKRKNIDGAIAAGMKGILFTSASNYEKQLMPLISERVSL